MKKTASNLFFRLHKAIAIRFINKYSKEISQYNPDLCTYLYDDISRDVLFNGEYEKENIDLALEFLANRGLVFDAFFDVGANIGTTSLNVSKKFKNIYSIEANPKTFSLLKLNTAHVKNITLFEVALSSKKGNSNISFFDGGYAGAFLSKNKKKDNTLNYIKVKTDTLDNLTKSLSLNKFLIKMDIEGEEYNAMLGALKTIRKYRPVYIIEINKREIKNSSSNAFNFLKELNYVFFNVQNKYTGNNPLLKRFFKNWKKEVVKIESLEKKFRLYPTLICVPSEKINFS